MNVRGKVQINANHVREKGRQFVQSAGVMLKRIVHTVMDMVKRIVQTATGMA